MRLGKSRFGRLRWRQLRLLLHDRRGRRRGLRQHLGKCRLYERRSDPIGPTVNLQAYLLRLKLLDRLDGRWTLDAINVELGS